MMRHLVSRVKDTTGSLSLHCEELPFHKWGSWCGRRKQLSCLSDTWFLLSRDWVVFPVRDRGTDSWEFTNDSAKARYMQSSWPLCCNFRKGPSASLTSIWMLWPFTLLPSWIGKYPSLQYLTQNAGLCVEVTFLWGPAPPPLWKSSCLQSWHQPEVCLKAGNKTDVTWKAFSPPKSIVEEKSSFLITWSSGYFTVYITAQNNAWVIFVFQKVITIGFSLQPGC